MKFVNARPYADPDAAARKLVEIANSLEPYMDGRLLVRVTCVSGSAYNLLMLLPPNNSIFVPASEQHISIFTTASRL